jgi:short-subunit dehydrogenase
MAKDHRVVVITGASRGIGVAIARDLAPRSEHVVLAARDAAGLEAAAAEVKALGAAVTVVPCDVTRSEDRARLLAAADAAGPVDVLVNNAGIEITIAVLDQTEADVERQIEVNLLSPLLLTRSFAQGMVSRGKGAIVQISSMSGKSPTPYNAIYTATKHGLNGFTASLRIELEGTGVHAGVVCPSFIAETGMWHDTGVKAPMAMREVSPAKVVAAVNRVIAGSGEVLVTPGPIRPLLAFGQLFPGLDSPLLKMIGVLDALKERARVTQARRSA